MEDCEQVICMTFKLSENPMTLAMSDVFGFSRTLCCKWYFDSRETLSSNRIRYFITLC